MLRNRKYLPISKMPKSHSFFCRKIRSVILALLPLPVALVTGCQTVTIPVPDGFAFYQAKSGKEIVRAVSPERVIYRVRPVQEEAQADLEFWATAIETHFKKAGYIIVEQKPITAASLPGRSFILASTYAGKDYSYLLSIFVTSKGVMLIEAAGENAHFEKYRQQIAIAVQQTNFAQLECVFCQIRPLSVNTPANGKSQD